MQELEIEKTMFYGKDIYLIESNRLAFLCVCVCVCLLVKWLIRRFIVPSFSRFAMDFAYQDFVCLVSSCSKETASFSLKRLQEHLQNECKHPARSKSNKTRLKETNKMTSIKINTETQYNLKTNTNTILYNAMH